MTGRHFVWVPASFVYLQIVCVAPCLIIHLGSGDVVIEAVNLGYRGTGGMMDRCNGVVGGERMNQGLSQACRSCENTPPHTQRLGPIPTSCVLRSFLSPLSWYCVSELLPGLLSSCPLVSPRGQTCEPHMVCWNCCLWEHASACPDFIRGIKERGGEIKI